MPKEKLVTPVPHHLKSVLPALIALKSFKNVSPGDILDIISMTLQKDGWKTLSPEGQQELRDYLHRWGLEDYTQKEE